MRTRMRTTTRLAATAATCLALALGACGDDDDGGGAGSSLQSRVADNVMDEAEDEDVELDRACVDVITAQLSDEDAQVIVDSIGSDEDPDVSDEGDALAAQIFGCASDGDIVDALMENFDQEGLDEDCVRGVLEGYTSEELAAIGQSGSDASSGVMEKLRSDLVPCTISG